MIFNLVKNETDLGELHKLTESFFAQLDSVVSFDEIIFPEWYKAVFGRTGLGVKLEELFKVYKKLSEQQQRKVITAIQETNKVSDLCENNFGLKAVCLEKFPEEFQLPLKELFIYLWENALPFHKFQAHFSTGLNNYIDEFIARNGHIEVCPFCALESFYNFSGQSRIEIDHWLCKKQYPHLAVNFDNLVPIGHYCNPSPVKGDKDVLASLNKHQRAYYPYCKHDGISVVFNFLNEPTLTNEIKKGDWELVIKPNNPKDKDLVESWKKIFNIQQRYEGVISDNVFKLWESKFIKRFPEPANNLVVFRSNLLKFKETFDRKEQPLTLMYWAFLDYLIERASERYLEGLRCNFERLAESEKKLEGSH